MAIGSLVAKKGGKGMKLGSDFLWFARLVMAILKVLMEFAVSNNGDAEDEDTAVV